MPFTAIGDGLLEKLVATRALTQLNRINVYPRTAIVGYEPGAFERGNEVPVRRPKRRLASDFDPRAGSDLAMTEGGFFFGNVKLEKLWADAYPIYGHDPMQSIQRYVVETASQIADAIATPNDGYMYDCFRTWSATTGNIALGDHPPIAIVANEDSSGNLIDFDNAALRNVGKVFDKQNVPDTDRFCVISSDAKSAFLGDAVVVTGFAAAMMQTQSGSALLQDGLPQGEFVRRYNFNVGGSNTVKGQDAVTDLSTASNAQATINISAVAANNNWTYADEAVATPVGAVDVTLGLGTGNALTPGVAVGKIARLGATNARAIAYGVILRIAATDPENPVITLVPYSPDGNVVLPSGIATNTPFGIPRIGSVNTAHHREALLMANRMIAEPRPGSGATAISLVDPQSLLPIQIIQGTYELRRLRESVGSFMLTGSKISDLRKAALILTK